MTAAKEVFSNSGNSTMQKWNRYFAGDERRQKVLETALDWVSGGKVLDYMGRHRFDKDCRELQAYFASVIDWIDGVLSGVKDEMCGLEWGRLYETYRKSAYDPGKVWKRVEELFADEFVTDRRGIFEFILGGEKNTRLLNVRVFSEKEKRVLYARQTAAAEKKGVSNCPLCAIGRDVNAKRIWKPSEMDADHVKAWSKGGTTDIANCQMLCKTHNRAKGNR